MAAIESMFAYICLGSNDLERSAVFYDATLGVLGYSRCDTSAESETSWNGWIGWGLYEKEGAVQDALWVCKPFNGAPATVGNGAWWRCGRRPGARSRHFMPRRWRMAELRKARRSATAVQPGFLCGLRARSGRQQARGGVPRLHLRRRANDGDVRPGASASLVFTVTIASLAWRLAFAYLMKSRIRHESLCALSLPRCSAVRRRRVRRRARSPRRCRRSTSRTRNSCSPTASR